MSAEGEKNQLKFLEWAASNPYRMMISYPRSGRTWITGVVRALTDKISSSTHLIDGNNYNSFAMILHHGSLHQNELVEVIHNAKLVLVIRDPRDCAISDAYRRVYFTQHPEITELTEEVIESAIQAVLDRWAGVISAFAGKADLVLQYEKICMAPVSAFRNIMKVLGLEPQNDIEATVTWKDEVSRVEEVDGKLTRLKEDWSFPKHWERYLVHSLKWQDDERFLESYNERIFTALHRQMEDYGYLIHSHDTSRWRKEIERDAEVESK